MNKKCYLTAPVFFIATFLFFSINNSYALKELNIPTPELARTSSDIVVARCISSEARVDEKTGFIFTYTTFKVGESLKGVYDDELVLKVVGGTVNGITLNSPFLPRFVPDEDVVLFLGSKNAGGYPPIKSINKGVYRVATNNSGTQVVTTPVRDLKLFSSVSNQKIKAGSKLTLDDFIYSINETL